MSENDAAKLQENNQEQEPEVTMESLMGELLDSEGFNIDIPTAGEIRDGIIASLSENQILVSIGAKSEGIIAGKEYGPCPVTERDQRGDDNEAEDEFHSRTFPMMRSRLAMPKV